VRAHAHAHVQKPTYVTQTDIKIKMDDTLNLVQGSW
jgi:hypothetical protein